MGPVLTGTTDILRSSLVHPRGPEILTQVGLGLSLDYTCIYNMRKCAFALIITTVSNKKPRNGFRIDVTFEKINAERPHKLQLQGKTAQKINKMVSQGFP